MYINWPGVSSTGTPRANIPMNRRTRRGLPPGAWRRMVPLPARISTAETWRGVWIRPIRPIRQIGQIGQIGQIRITAFRWLSALRRPESRTHRETSRRGQVCHPPSAATLRDSSPSPVVRETVRSVCLSGSVDRRPRTSPDENGSCPASNGAVGDPYPSPGISGRIR
jgi:hypothetical protein